jgi:hypothetical protein
LSHQNADEPYFYWGISNFVFSFFLSIRSAAIYANCVDACNRVSLGAALAILDKAGVSISWHFFKRS